MNEKSFKAIDVYDNAMFIIALDYLQEMSQNPEEQKNGRISGKISPKMYALTYGMEKNQQVHSHITGQSPIPEGFDENKVHYHGGTAVAIEAGLLTREEIATVNQQMLENVRLSGMPSIGLTLLSSLSGNFFTGGMPIRMSIRTAATGPGSEDG